MSRPGRRRETRGLPSKVAAATRKTKPVSGPKIWGLSDTVIFHHRTGRLYPPGTPAESSTGFNSLQRAWAEKHRGELQRIAKENGGEVVVDHKKGVINVGSSKTTGWRFTPRVRSALWSYLRQTGHQVVEIGKPEPEPERWLW